MKYVFYSLALAFAIAFPPLYAEALRNQQKSDCVKGIAFAYEKKIYKCVEVVND